MREAGGYDAALAHQAKRDAKQGIPPNGAVDRSDHPTAVEYGVRELMKGKSPAAAAKSTAKKLSSHPNVFLGSPTDPVFIDPKTLETKLWHRMRDFVISNIAKMRPGKEDYALDGAAQHFNQKPEIAETLRELVIEKLGRDPFSPPGLTPNAHVTKAQALARASELGHRMSRWSGHLGDRAACMECAAELVYESAALSRRGGAHGRALQEECTGKPLPLSPNAGHYVWAVASNGTPVSGEMPFGPLESGDAESYARSLAIKGRHNRVVSRSKHPDHASFKLIAEYAAGTGARRALH